MILSCSDTVLCQPGSTGCAGAIACGQGQCWAHRCQGHPINDGDAAHTRLPGGSFRCAYNLTMMANADGPSHSASFWILSHLCGVQPENGFVNVEEQMSQQSRAVARGLQLYEPAVTASWRLRMLRKGDVGDADLMRIRRAPLSAPPSKNGTAPCNSESPPHHQRVDATCCIPLLQQSLADKL